MDAETATLVGVGLNTFSAIFLFVSVLIMGKQTKEIRQATYAGSFKAVYDMLQNEEVRSARKIVLGELANKAANLWNDEEKETAEKVCFSFDSVGIMARNRLVPPDVVAGNWNDSLRRTWQILYPMVQERRVLRASPDFWDDYEWLVLRADKLFHTSAIAPAALDEPSSDNPNGDGAV